MASQPLHERGIRSGERAELIRRTGPEHGIALGRSGAATVYSTPSMINLMEHAAKKLLAGYLRENEESVGTSVEVEHLAPTPLGVDVRAVADVISVADRTIDFEVTAFDPEQQIGKGRHRRAVVDVNRFAERLPKPESPSPVGAVAPWSDLDPDRGALPRFANLDVRLEGAVATAIINRPAALNALDPATVDDLEALVRWLAGHADEIYTVILTGTGRSFCAGSDIRAVASMSVGEASDFSLRQGRLGNRLSEIPQPVIAAINGYAYGGGCVLAAHCDLRIASLQATFSMPEIKLGWPGGWGMDPLLRHIGPGRMMDLCLTGRVIDAREAETWGLVNKSVPAGRLTTEARQMADQLLALPPLALRENKWLVHRLAGPAARHSYHTENEAYIRCLETADARERIDAFLEKRKARGR